METQVPPQQNLLVSVADAARMLSLSRPAVEILIASGELPSLKIGRRRLIRTADLDAFVQTRAEQAAEEDIVERSESS